MTIAPQGPTAAGQPPRYQPPTIPAASMTTKPRTAEWKRRPKGRPPLEQRSGRRQLQGQTAPPLLLAAVESPEAQSWNVPAAVASYRYEAPLPVQPEGSVGSEFRNGPPICPCWLFCCTSRAPD